MASQVMCLISLHHTSCMSLTPLSSCIVQRQAITVSSLLCNLQATVAGAFSLGAPCQVRSHLFALQPITIMRNSLGTEEGGSGVPLDRQKYEESAAYWDQRAAILSGSTPGGE